MSCKATGRITTIAGRVLREVPFRRRRSDDAFSEIVRRDQGGISATNTEFTQPVFQAASSGWRKAHAFDKNRSLCAAGQTGKFYEEIDFFFERLSLFVGIGRI
ncbi:MULTISPECIES: hypothetical protein [Burkholderia]|uniref:hypothetical protein n=1 Tax=Burkholderia TaxID=32008 RepID=UPI001269FFA7|nr:MULTISPECIES: hypothetical protein [Burkholderia]